MSSIDYIIERSTKRRRTIAVLIRENRVVVQAPQKTPDARIDEIIEAKTTWIIKKLEENQTQTLLTKKQYIDGELFKFLGKDYPLVISEAPIKKVAAAVFGGGCIAVKVPAGLSGQERATQVRDALIRWYRPRAKNLLNKTADRWAAKTGLKPGRIRVKELKRSWGICTRNDISLCWRLVMAPAPLIEYVVVHELCHLRHKNHSAKYYEFLASFMPDYKSRRKELRKISPFLEL